VKDSRRVGGLLATSAAAVIVYPFVGKGFAQAIIYDGLALVAAVAALLGGRRQPQGERRAWFMFSAGFYLFFVGDVIWDVYELGFNRESPVPSFADWAFVAAYVALIGGAIAMLRRSGRPEVTAHLIDAAIVAIGMAIVCWEPLLMRVGGSTSKAFVAGIYPVGDAAVMALVITLVVRRRLSIAGSLLAVGIAALAVADVAFLILSRTDSYATGDWPDLLFMFGPIAMAAAALAPDAGDLVDTPPARYDRLTSIVLACVSLFAVPFGLLNPGDLSSTGRLAGVLLRVVFLALVATRVLRLAFTEERARDVLATTSTRLMTVAENAGAAVAYTAEDGTILEWNTAAERLFGVTREDVVGKNFVDRFGLRDRSGLWRDGPAVTQDILPVDVRGSRVLLALRREAVRRFGRITGYVVFAQDATREMLADSGMDTAADGEEIIPIVERLGGVLHEAVHFDVLSLYAIEDGDYRELASLIATAGVVRAHPGWHARRGRPTPEVLQRLSRDPVVIVQDLGSAHGELERFIRGAGDALRSAIVVPLRSEVAVHSVLLVGFSDANAVSASVVDLVGALAPLLSRAVRRMLVSSHERDAVKRIAELEDLRNTFLQVVAEELSPARAQALGLDFAGVADRVAQFARDLVEVARASTVGFPCSAVRIHNAPEIITTAARAAAGSRGDDLRIDLRCSGAVKVDPDRLAQVVGNLVTHAVGESERGSPVEVSARTEGAALRLAVRSHGPGLSAGALERLFDRNTRGAALLGLYLTRGIVEGHGGRIWAEATQGGGTTFHVDLPWDSDQRLTSGAGSSAPMSVPHSRSR
jgi:PAS domain S-box-containing protein